MQFENIIQSDQSPSHSLQDKGCHIWFIPSDKELNMDSSLSILSTDERKRANRFYFEKDKKKYILTRVFLREILSVYCHCNPKDLLFKYNEFGKPSVNNLGVRFNISHSDNLSVIAITNDGLLGIDIEKIREIENLDSIAHLVFSEDEYHYISKLSKEEQMHSFFDIWTIKEAYLKAIGKGFSHCPKSFSVKRLSPKSITLSFSKNNHHNWNIFSIKIDHRDQIYSLSLTYDFQCSDMKFFTSESLENMKIFR